MLSSYASNVCNFFATLFYLFFAQTSLAADWAGLYGKTLKGDSFVVSLSERSLLESDRTNSFVNPALYDINIYRVTKTGRNADYPQRTFKELLCTYFSEQGKSETHFFKCEVKKDYPMSGASYKITPFIANSSLNTEKWYKLCNAGRTDDIYTCIVACSNSVWTPKVLRHPPYECE